jgi:hypothetical protein
MNTPADIREFFSRVLPWPVEEDGKHVGYIDLTWTFPAKKAGDKRPFAKGRAFQTLDAFLSFIEWAKKQPRVNDIYYCTSLQSACDTNTRGQQIAVRDANNVLALKAIWLDVDGNKPSDPEKGYATKADAASALSQFLAKAGLPGPSAIVDSGNGYHVYWISDKPLTVAEWEPYAYGLWALVKQHGLRADPVTTDRARILRVPGTSNHKSNPAEAVRLIGLSDTYDFAATFGSMAATPKATSKQPVPFALSASSDQKPAAAFSHLDPLADKLSDGIGAYSDTPLDPTEIFKNCPHYQDAARSHGAVHGQALWMLTILATTWFEDGRRWAHYLSKGYPSYAREETDAMYDRKLSERAKGLGWPSCEAFENMGCKLCAACSHKGKIRSPLNLAVPRNLPSGQNAEQVSQQTLLPVEAIRTLRERGADIEQLLAAMNETFAVVRYRSEILVANILGKDIIFMTEQDFHKMFANLTFFDPKTIASNLQEMKLRIEQAGTAIASMSLDDFEKMFADLILIVENPVKVSRRWFSWSGRRQYFGRGVGFEPGGPLEVKHDMLNLWRGFAIEPKQGDWSRLRNHIQRVVCSGSEEHFNYLIRWMAYAVQRPSEPIGVAVAFRGAPGAGKGIVARTLGGLFGAHFSHIANGEQLVGRFNASLGTSCFVFLDEALWGGDKKGEGVLKALITEPRLQLEAKFRDPIMVDNRLRIMVASNEDWVVPTGLGDRRWFIVDVASTFAGTEHPDYWDPIYAEIDNGGKAALFYDLMTMDLTGFNVRAVPHTAAKAQQQAHSLHGTDAWLYHVLQEGRVGSELWQQTGLQISTDHAYLCYEDFSKRQRHYRPDTKSVWSKKIRSAFGRCLTDARIGQARDRSFRFASLAACRRQYEIYAGAPNIEWEPECWTEDTAAADQATEEPHVDGDFAREPDEGEGHPVSQPTRDTGASEILSRAKAQRAAHGALVRDMK